MNKFLANVKELRSDLSDWVVHFTKGTDAEAESRLKVILSEAKLRSFCEPPFISFSEAPLGELNKLFALFRAYPEPRFAPYGIAVPKEWLFERGGRHAIYGPADDYEELPAAQRYRHVTYHPHDYDFTWQREWRIAANQLAIEPASTLVVLPNDQAAFGLTCDVEAEGEYEGPGEFSMNYYLIHEWRSLALDQIARQELHQDVLIAKSIREQELHEPET